MKSTLVIVAMLLFCSFVYADIEMADSPDDVKRFLEENQDNTVALFFIDSSLTEGSEGGFWKGVVTSVSHIFAGEEETGGSRQRVAEIEKDISNDAALMQIDVSNEDLREIQESYDVTTVPFLIVFKRGIVVLKEVPTAETHDKILQVLNVNPASVHNEEESTVVVSGSSETSASAPEQPAPESRPTPTAAPTESSAPVPRPTSAQAAEPTPSYRSTEPERSTQANSTSQNTTTQEQPKHITLAPGEKEQREAPVQERPSRTPNVKREFIHHQCHDVTTFDDESAKRWRDSPFYIAELEDFELPEDWWRNGYGPLEGNNTESRTRTIAFSEQETIVSERSAPPMIIAAPAPVLIRPEPHHRPAPMRVVEPVRVAEPIVVEPMVRPVSFEPRLAPQRYVSKHLAGNSTAAGPAVTTTRTSTGAPSGMREVRRHEVPSQVPISGGPASSRVVQNNEPRRVSPTAHKNISGPTVPRNISGPTAPRNISGPNSPQPSSNSSQQALQAPKSRR